MSDISEIYSNLVTKMFRVNATGDFRIRKHPDAALTYKEKKKCKSCKWFETKLCSKSRNPKAVACSNYRCKRRK